MSMHSKQQFQDQVRRLIGIDLSNIIDQDNVRQVFKISVEQNLQLIKTLSQRQLSRFKNTVLTNLQSGEYNAAKIIEQLTKDFGMTKRHAKFIARDQSHKLIASLSLARYENIGVREYTWKNAHDRRVRGNPGGLYPNAKYNHWTREGKTFSFDDPPPDGNPGMPYNCRCYAQPHINELLNKFTGEKIHGQEIKAAA